MKSAMNLHDCPPAKPKIAARFVALILGLAKLK